jgi:hypothetical protein
MSGKGSNPRPFSISQDNFASNWDRIFNKNNTGTEKNEYYDVVQTEDAVLDALQQVENDESR